MIRELFKYCTVSTMLITPIFSDIIKIKYFTMEYNFIALLYNKGFINSFLYENNNNKNNNKQYVL